MATLAPTVPAPPAAPSPPLVPAPGTTLPAPQLDQRAGSKAIVASQWQLMYWRFMRHRLAVASTFVVAFFYLVAVFCEFLAPMDPNKISNQFRYVPPQQISFVDAAGRFSLRPGVYALKSERNPETLRVSYTVDKARWTPISFFVKGDPYRFWGLWRTDLHLMGLSRA